jgi:DNA-binding response OmpR family regulator
MNAHVLVAEDNHLQAEVIRRYLEHDGHRTTVVRDGHAALRAARRCRPDLMILDLMLPGIDGLEVCRTLRQESDLLVLMLTARATEPDLLLGLATGADDYLTKPASPRELLARVRTLLRRAGRAPLPTVAPIRYGPVMIDPDRRAVEVAGRAVTCTATEFEILLTVASQAGRVFTRRQLLERTSHLDGQSTERAIDVHIRNLRKKIERDPSHPELLLTVFGIGYKMATDQGPPPRHAR